MRKAIASLLTLIVAGLCATAQTSRAADVRTADTDAAADTVSAALATVWSSHITPVLEQKYAADSNAVSEFMRGIADAFDVSPAREPYFQGILQGLAVVQRLDQMKQLGFPVDNASFLAALTKTVNGHTVGFTPTTADRYLNDYMTRKYEQQMAADTLSTESQRQFMEREAARDGVIKTPSGLLFEVITEGEGSGPSLDDAVTVTYTGRLYNGEVFDDSESDVTFPVSGLVPGFTQGLLMMKPGGTYRIIIPADLGYGPKGTAGVIPGNAALDFTITLHRVVKR